MNTSRILLDNSKTPEEKVYLIAKAIKDSGRSIDCDLWYAILDLKDKNFPIYGNDSCYSSSRESEEA